MLIDGALIKRLESSAAALSGRIAEVMVATEVPGANPPVPWCSGLLVALGPDRYLNRAVGFGAADVPADQLAVAEEFFRDAGVPPMFEVSSWGSTSLLTALGECQYRPLWTRNVFARSGDGIQSDQAQTERIPGLEIREVGDALTAWQAVLADGNELTTELDRRVSDEFALARFQVPDAPILLAMVDGVVAGCASIEVYDGVAWLGGAATDPAFRNRGVQAALLHHRLLLALEAQCDLVAASAMPTGASARNLSRHGFDLAYTQTEYVR